MAFVRGDLDEWDFDLAEHLHLPLRYVREDMPNNEYLQWRALAVYRASKREVGHD